jgi:carbonic anhydrase
LAVAIKGERMQGCCSTTPASRRGVLKALALGGGASLMLTGRAAAAGHCEVLLLSCMDYRLADELAAYMQGRGLKDNYDHVILAGASLGALTDKRPDWGHTFWEHLDAAIQLHRIGKVMVIDHRDCGAYRLFLGEAAAKDPDTELASHAEQLRRLRTAIKGKHAELEVELGLMALDGSVQTIA